MGRLAILDTVAVTGALLPHLPSLHGRTARPLQPPFPAVTSTVQADMLTGATPDMHGIVANGWLHPDLHEIHFWKQSARLLQRPRVWDLLKRHRPGFRTAQLFWWFAMGGTADIVVTPRPQYRADGSKVPDLHTVPGDLRDTLQQRLGRFPLFRFWGPLAGIESTRWIAEATRLVAEQEAPDLLLSYLPHLDYDLQRFGPGTPEARAACVELDAVLGPLIRDLEARGYTVWVVNEYGIEAVDRCIPINRILREAGLLRVRDEGAGGEHLDLDNSRAFAVADHQIAHVHHGADVPLPPIPYTRAVPMEHPRAGRTVLTAEPGAWFSYDFWLDDARAPDFARTVDIHRKPGYDPRELFSDAGRASVAWKLARRKLGFAQPLDVVPLNPLIVRGSHGRAPLLRDNPAELPLWIGGPGDVAEPLDSRGLFGAATRFFGVDPNGL